MGGCGREDLAARRLSLQLLQASRALRSRSELAEILTGARRQPVSHSRRAAVTPGRRARSTARPARRAWATGLTMGIGAIRAGADRPSRAAQPTSNLIWAGALPVFSTWTPERGTTRTPAVWSATAWARQRRA